MLKLAFFKIRGMLRDLSESAFNPEYSYENKNIRIMSTTENTTLSVTNEKGTRKFTVNGLNDYVEGTPIGQAVIGDYFVLFTTNNLTRVKRSGVKYDYIYRFNLSGASLNGVLLYNGNLDFNVNNPIETIVFYENENILKVFWTDGLNQPRLINIVAVTTVMNSWIDSSFNFVPTLNLKEEIGITKEYISNGKFTPGTIQYSFSYFNAYGLESNIFYTSPLYYISYQGRGGKPDDTTINNSFTINLKNPDTNFEYLRIYSMHRTTTDATPTVKLVVDLHISNASVHVTDDGNDYYYIQYTDNGGVGTTVDSADLLYVGGELINFYTFAQKDNKLFIGNINLLRSYITDTIKQFFRGKVVTFEASKQIDEEITSGIYPYKNLLESNSQLITTYKYLEWYRFGILAQHYTGKWSEPIWINDLWNDVSPSTEIGNLIYNLVKATYTLSDNTIILALYNLGYIKIRPVIVFPTLSDLSVIALGVVNPTVFCAEDRHTNSPFVLSSWFFRPNIPFDESNSSNLDTITDPITGEKYEKAGMWSMGDNWKRGKRLTYKHYYGIPGGPDYAAEFYLYMLGHTPARLKVSNDISLTDIFKRADLSHYVDLSIFTFHSPEIEFNENILNLDLSNFKFRIIGYVPITGTASDIDVLTSTSVTAFAKHTVLTPIGFKPCPMDNPNTSHYGYGSLSSGPMYFDELYTTNTNYTNGDLYETAFYIFPWHRDGALNNDRKHSDGTTRSSLLSTKVLSNLRFSLLTKYLSNNKLWYAEDSYHGYSLNNGISEVQIFNSNESSLIKLKAPLNSGLTDLIYYGNIDRIITYDPSSYSLITVGGRAIKDYYSALYSSPLILYKYTEQTVSLSIDGITYSYPVLSITDLSYEETINTDPTSVKYKSGIHAVIALNYGNNGEQRILPTSLDKDSNNNDISVNNLSGSLGTNKFFWDSDHKTNYISQDTIQEYITYGYLWLGELYRDNVTNRFGGQTEEAFELNTWLPAGEPVNLLDSTNTLKSSLTLLWTEGDTYYQRYDHLKTYPYTSKDLNQIVDIISFMVESRINLDGRYDRNRGQKSNLTMTPTNFNLLNTAYTLDNNYFNYNGLNTNKIQLNNFPNTISWSLSKSSGDLVDKWTNLTLASTLDLDGDKGSLNALRRFNNNIIAFLDSGISILLYNQRTQMSTELGIPVLIANSGLVDGKLYITEGIGCTNKWSIVTSPSGLYFIDDINKAINLFNGTVTNISDKFGFHSWINVASKNTNSWDSLFNNGMVSYYDKTNGDVFFISKDECLVFSEPLLNFTSFFSYNNSPYFATLKDSGIWINTDKSITGSKYYLWEHTLGNYNEFFGLLEDYYVDLIINDNPNYEKIFNTLEFKADTYNNGIYQPFKTFDKIEVWNEYQQASKSLTFTKGVPSNLKKKFMIWGATIPRDSSNNRDRIRSPWVHTKLIYTAQDSNKTILHNLTMHYSL